MSTNKKALLDNKTIVSSSTCETPAPVPAPTAPVRPFRPIDFYARLKKKAVKCKCTNGIVIEGILLAYNPYELCIEIANGGEIILSKHSILFTTENRSASTPAPAPKKAES